MCFLIPAWFLELCLRLPSLYFDWLLTCQLCLFFTSQICLAFFLLTWHYIRGKLLNFTCWCQVQDKITIPYFWLLFTYAHIKPTKRMMKVCPLCVFNFSMSTHSGILWKSITRLAAPVHACNIQLHPRISHYKAHVIISVLHNMLLTLGVLTVSCFSLSCSCSPRHILSMSDRWTFESGTCLLDMLHLYPREWHDHMHVTRNTCESHFLRFWNHTKPESWISAVAWWFQFDYNRYSRNIVLHNNAVCEICELYYDCDHTEWGF